MKEITMEQLLRSSSDPMKLLFMWTKQGVISLKEFKKLAKLA